MSIVGHGPAARTLGHLLLAGAWAVDHAIVLAVAGVALALLWWNL